VSVLAAGIRLLSLALGAMECTAVAGEYYLGDGTGVNWSLDLRPDGTFRFTWDGCLGNYDEKSGSWCYEDGIVSLDLWSRKPDPVFSSSLPASLRAVTWGDRLYLVADSELIDFCNAVNDGGEPRDLAWGSFFLREEDWSRPATGAPKVPDGYREQLLSAPVRGRLVARIDERSGTVDRGERDGLRPGMTLYLQRAFDLVSYRVRRVASATCEVELELGDEVAEGPVSTLLWDDTMRPPPGRAGASREPDALESPNP
jgi:hypothetical protein